MTNETLKVNPPRLTLGESVALGFIGGAIQSHRVGFNASITGANEEAMWSPGAGYTWPAAAAGMEIISASANDTNTAGTGARTVTIEYLTSAGVEKTETVALNGVGVVPTVGLDIYRINAFYVATAGSGGVAAGNINLRNLADTPVYAQIAAGETRAEQLIYTVPAGKALLLQAFAWASSGTVGTSYLRYTLKGTFLPATHTLTSVYYDQMEVSVQNTGFVYALPTPLYVPAGADLIMVVIGDASTAAATATASWRGLLMDA